MPIITYQPAVLFPVLALVAWTFIVLMQIPLRRFKAAFAKEVRPSDFLYGESANVPGHVSIPNRNYMNLLEAPVLLYVACVTAYVAHAASPALLAMAWVYVVLRVVHSLVHLTYNNVFHRLVVFASSNFVLAVMWVNLGMKLAA